MSGEGTRLVCRGSTSRQVPRGRSERARVHGCVRTRVCVCVCGGARAPPSVQSDPYRCPRRAAEWGSLPESRPAAGCGAARPPPAERQREDEREKEMNNNSNNERK